MLRALIYADLVGLDESAAKRVVLEALEERAKPDIAPAFPGGVPRAPSSSEIDPGNLAKMRVLTPRSFPGKASSAVDVWQEKLEFLRLQEPVIVDTAQKFSLKKQIEEAEYKIRKFGG